MRITDSARLLALTLVPWALIVTACGDDGSSGSPEDSSTSAATTDDGSTTSNGSSSSDDSSTSGGSTTADTSSGSGTALPSCDGVMNAIVTDIDETLTISDAEWTMQIGDGTYDPISRDGSAELIQAYADRGYRILYLTARPVTVTLGGTGESAEDATQRWLEEHDFPLGPRTEIQLAPSLVFDDSARDYKAQEIMNRQADGWVFDDAYGNALSDIGAYDLASIDKAATFIIGENAGAEGTVAIAGEDWLGHIADHLPDVPAVCSP